MISHNYNNNYYWCLFLLTYFSDLNLCFQGCCHFLFIQKAALNDLFLLLFKQQQQKKTEDLKYVIVLCGSY